jgi:DNA-binding IclR family transcriptional regulator
MTARSTASPRGEAPKRKRTGDQSVIAAVDRAARILVALARAMEPVALPEIARLSGMTRPTAFRILATLAAEGLVLQDAATSTYSLGFLALRLADTVLGSFPIHGVARPVMRHIRDALNETVVLSLREGDSRFNIDSLESTHAIGQTQKIGMPIPLYAGAASRVLLAGMPDEEIAAYLQRVEFQAFTDTTITRREDLLAEIQRIRQQGYAASSGEFTAGGHAIASAILDSRGRAVAALHVSFPRGRFSPELEERCVSTLVEGTRAIAESLPELATRHG